MGIKQKLEKLFTPAPPDRDAQARQRIEELAADFAQKADRQRAHVGLAVRFEGHQAPNLDGLNLPDGVTVGLTQEGVVEISAVPPALHPDAVKG